MVVQGSGNDLAESRRAIEWMQLVLFHPDWRPANLPRIRDLVEQQLAAYRNAMQGAEERWVRNPINAYLKQTDPLYLTINSFLTGAHNVDRLRWMLKDTGTPEDRASISSFLDNLAGTTGSDHTALKKLLAATEAEPPNPKLTPRARELAIEVAKDLEQLLPDLPDATLAADWRYLCNRIREDLAVTPEAALERLDRLRASLLKTGNARVWMVGSSDSRQKLEPKLQAFVGQLRGRLARLCHYSDVRRIDERLKQHQGDSATPRFVGLFNANCRAACSTRSLLAPITTARTVSRSSDT